MELIEMGDDFFTNSFTQVFDFLDDGLMVVDKNGKLVIYNRASEKLDELDRADVLGKHIKECFEMNKHFSLTLKTLKTKKASKNVYQSYTTNRGKKVSSVSSSYPLIKNNEMLGVLTLTKDITSFQEILDVFYKHDISGTEIDDGKAKFTFNQIIGKNPTFEKSIDLAKIASKTKSNILIYGETGTGKELFAQSIHNSSLVNGKFVSINCAAIPENLLEGILFGTTKGAFTGAMDHPGLFEEAMDGTLFLDELNSMSLNLQSKLLRAIETGKIRRIGETKERIVKPRILSALNIHPLNAIEQNLIRRDLFYRLGVVTVVIPPLKERLNDIPLLVDEFIKKYNVKFSKNVKGVTEDVKKVFQNHDWLGNVRELEHAIEHSMITIGQNKYIDLQHLPTLIVENSKNKHNRFESQLLMDNINIYQENMDLNSTIEEIERSIIEASIEKNNGNIAQSARELGLNRQTLEYRIRKYNLK